MGLLKTVFEVNLQLFQKNATLAPPTCLLCGPKLDANNI